MSYSIIVPHHAGRQLLDYCLQTLRATVPDDVEIIVVLNNDDQDEVRIALDETRYRALRVTRDLGYGGAINLGADAASGQYLVFCDNDTSFLPGWFEALVNGYHAATNIGSASAKLISPTSGRIVDFGIAFTEYNAPHPFMDAEPDHPLVRRSRPVQAACSAVMMIEKQLFEDAGRFSGRPHSYYNDIDLCLRVRERGYEPWVIAESVAFHKSSFRGARAAPYKSSALKADQKAWFMGRYGSKLRIDMQVYLAEAFAHFRRDTSPAAEYVIIDLASVVDRDWYCDVIREALPTRDVYRYPSYERDSTALSLAERLGVNVMALRVPFIYFVDRFVCLGQNTLWASLREHHGDVVVDRNGNVRRFVDVAAASEVLRG
ncbi:MAG TPA: glycosyltransferase [Thermoanaerobaculia bacterium]|nr:glycosyltransferase [Thermoanaerobaculia bacterium]